MGTILSIFAIALATWLVLLIPSVVFIRRGQSNMDKGCKIIFVHEEGSIPLKPHSKPVHKMILKGLEIKRMYVYYDNKLVASFSNDEYDEMMKFIRSQKWL